MLTPKQQKIHDLLEEGRSQRDIAEELGISRSAVRTHMQAIEKRAKLGEGIADHLDGFGFGDLRGQHSGYVRKQGDDGSFATVYYYFGKDGASEDLTEMLQFSIENGLEKQRPARPVVPKPTGDNLLVVNIADLHIGRLCVAAETGFDYSGQVAAERAMYGVDSLLKRAKPHGIGHIFVVIGNDKMHFDTPRRMTTSGTPQDADTTLFEMYRNAKGVDRYIIDACRKVAPVTLIHCPSNHDWVMGWCLAQDHQSYYRDCPEVSAQDYYVSEQHRKYAVFGGDLMLFTHGDGAKSKDLSQLIMHEARAHISSCKRTFVYTAHLHHKVRETIPGGIREKDLPAMTVINGQPMQEGIDIPIEVVRSPAPPDGWHDRNGYVNRQAVEAFLHSPEDGQFLRITQWF